MTDYKERGGGIGYRSLYTGLLYSLLRGLLFAVIGWLVIMTTSYYFIGVHYVKPDLKSQRRVEYIEDLQLFVEKNGVGYDNAVEIAEWVRENPYVFIIVYYNLPKDSYAYETDPDEDVRPGEFRGSRIDESLQRDTLAKEASSGGYHRVQLYDGRRITVAIAEYTENLYYSSFNLVSVAAALLIFLLVPIRYTRELIDRIKRFESDVTIVSEIDMGYEIVSEGADEISTLSSNVEQMRRRMLEHIKSEQEAHETNAALIASISHDIRTPLTVLMGYLEMMKEHGTEDEVMAGYISATESTAHRLKQLSDDMFKYSLAFGDTESSVKLDEYDAATLLEQLLSEHFLLMREMGYEIRLSVAGEPLKAGSLMRTDPPNLMRIIDNVFSNLRKYADISQPILLSYGASGSRLMLECRNTIRKDTAETESHGIGLKTCKRLASLIAEKFEYAVEGDSFVCRLYVPLTEQKQEE